LWNNGTPKTLSPDVFLICGDRACQGIPSKAYGGPCYLGKLILFTPHRRDWLNISKITKYSRTKRSLQHLKSNCKDDVELWSFAAKVFASSFAPGVAAAQALRQLEKLACWSIKQANVTTDILNQLLYDQNSLRHALLQNRAAIDFLLLARGHGCEDFEGMCCFNLSDHSESIHKKLVWLKEHTQKIVKDDNPFDDWLRSLFGNVSPWLIGLIKELLPILDILVLVLIVLRIAFA
ncbi:ENV1 protein, partial [Tricholaema leucomelas]|nr:ENV1 protein [Tricholaema leucomelas]